MKELEDKIRESLPRLKDQIDGTIIYKPHLNVFSQKYEGFEELVVFKGVIYDEDSNVISNKDIDESWLVSQPIKLNDVLEYHSKDKRDKYSHFEVRHGEGYFCIYDGEENESIVWDLSSVFLADQSERLKQFLNSL